MKLVVFEGCGKECLPQSKPSLRMPVSGVCGRLGRHSFQAELTATSFSFEVQCVPNNMVKRAQTFFGLGEDHIALLLLRKK